MGPDADILILFRLALRQLIVMVSVIGMSLYTMRALLGQCRSLKLLIAFYCLRLPVNNTLINIILQHYYGEELWWQVLYFFTVPCCGILTYLLLYMTFSGNFLKVSVGAVIGEVVGFFFLIPGMVAVNYLEGQPRLFNMLYPVQWLDLLIPVINTGLFCIFYYMAWPFLKKFRRYRLKNEKLFRLLFLLYLSMATLTVIPSRATFGVVYLPILLGGGTILCLSVFVFRNHSRKIRMEHDYLLSQRRLMESYYGAIKEQVLKMEQSRELIDRQMKQIYLMGTVGLENGRIFEYIKELKEQYKSIVAGVYCNDWAMDALLYYQESICRDAGIETDFFLPGFSRGCIQEEDIQQLFLMLLNYGIWQNRSHSGNRRIGIHAGTVKNQLVLQYTCTGSKGWKTLRRQMMKLIKKYNGFLDTEVRQKVLQMVIVLQKGSM